MKRAIVTKLSLLVEVLGDDDLDLKVQIVSQLQVAQLSRDSTIAALRSAGICDL